MTEIFKWKDDYFLGFKEIDDQHMFFHSALNDLHEKVISGAPKDEVKTILDDLIKYAENHFRTEERYFEKFNWNRRFDHIKRHEELKDRLTEFYKKFMNGEDIGVQIVTFLVEWLTLHLSTEDKKYIDCFKENGLK